MRKWNKLLALLLAMVMALGLTVTGFADGDEADEADAVEPFVVPEDIEGAIVILHTNDVHGAVENYAKVATLKAMYEEAGAEVILLDAGDFSQGTPYVSVSEGAAAIELMNLVGYDAAAPGNHEFDYGYENLKTLAEAAEFPILAANINYEDELAFEANKIFETKDGVKIGVFGLDTPETATKAHPAKIKGVTFAGGEDLYAIAQAQVDALKEAGCKYIICLSHLGIDDESAANGNRSIDLLANVNGINVVIDGHSHSTMEDIKNKLGNETGTIFDYLTGNEDSKGFLTSTGTKIANVGVVWFKPAESGDYTFNMGSIAAERIPVAEDNAVAARAAEIVAEIDAAYGEVFATSEVLLNGDRDPGNRTEETNLGDLITDAMRWYVTKDGEDLGVPAENVIALTNGGGIRAPIQAGDITKKDVNTVLPFGNTVAYVTITGEALLEALEASTYCTPTAVGGFPQVSGIDFTVDTNKTFDQGEAYEGTTYFAPASINRVTVNSVNGQEFDPEATYVVITNDFTAAGGDTYYTFSTSEVVDTGMALDEALMQYITEELEGTVSAEKYGEPAGRITIIAPAYTDVPADEWYVDAVNFVTENELMDGVTLTTFEPETATTRAVLAEALYRMAGSPEVTAENTFSDVADDASYKNAVIWAKEAGLVGGYEDGTFQPDAPIYRRDIATMLARFIQAEISEDEIDLSMFGDADSIQDYAKAYVSWAVANNILGGDGNGNMNPDNTAKRSEIAIILQRFAPLYEEANSAEETEASEETAETETEEEGAKSNNPFGSNAESVFLVLLNGLTQSK